MTPSARNRDRREGAAIAEYRKALELDREFAPAHWHLGWAYLQARRFDEGIAEAQKALALDDGNLLYLASVGHAYACAGKESEAGAILARLAQASTSRHVSAYHVAAVHVALGDTVAGLNWLDRAYDEQSPWIGYLAVDPRLASVRLNPRFRSLLARAHLDHRSDAGPRKPTLARPSSLVRAPKPEASPPPR